MRYRFGYNMDPRDFQEANYYVIESGKHSLWVALLALFFVWRTEDGSVKKK